MNTPSITTERVKIRNWDERITAVISSTPVAENKAHIECTCGATLTLHRLLDDYCPTQGCSPKAKAFRGTSFTRDFAANIEETAKTSTWFHSTLDPNWEETLTNPDLPPVHLGIREASEQLGKIEGVEYGFFLYEVQLTPDATIAPYICPDKRNHWAETNSKLKRTIKADFIGYFNLWEAAGNISLLGNGQKIKIISRKWFPRVKDRETCIENVRKRIEWARSTTAWSTGPYIPEIYAPQMEAMLSTLIKMTDEEFTGEKQLQRLS